MVLSFDTITTSPEKTQNVGKIVGASYLETAKSGSGRVPVMCLWGELGSGKTTFIQGFARGLGIQTRLVSPTFIIVRRYKIPDTHLFFHHMDLYRLTQKKAILDLGFDEFTHDTQNIVAIEWPERLADLLPVNRLDIKLNALPDGRHSIEMEHYGQT
jgi:tRNA threonylcarbamoyladenosine biosynthesis protein TsaE